MYLVYLPIFMGLLYAFYSILRKDADSDVLFIHSENLTREELLNRIALLEEQQKVDFSEHRNTIQALKIDVFRERDAEQIEEALVNTYFNGFEKRWVAFNKADWFLKLFFMVCLCSGFVVLGTIVYVNQDEPRSLEPMVFILPLIVFPASFIISLIYLGLITLVYTFLCFIFPKKGSVIKASVHLDEMLKALKPGGRDTRVEIPHVPWHRYTP